MGYILANPRPSAVIADPYDLYNLFEGTSYAPDYVPTTKKASSLGVPGLNVAVKDPSSYAYNYANGVGRLEPNFVRVAIRVGDILDQGGKIYKDTSALAYGIKPMIITLPEGRVKVSAIESLPEIRVLPTFESSSLP